MYHAFVRINGRWTSFGLHHSSPHWSNIYTSLQRTYGEDNVACTFWAGAQEVADVRTVNHLLVQEVDAANVVQEGRDNGHFPTHDTDGSPFSLAYGIANLKQPVKV